MDYPFKDELFKIFKDFLNKLEVINIEFFF